MTTKCVVAGCNNHKGEGVFVGDFCKPCHGYLQSGELPEYSDLYKNLLKKFAAKPDRKIFRLIRPSKIGKWINIAGPIELSVDFDDVDHRKALKDAKQVVRILNEHWPEE